MKSLGRRLFLISFTCVFIFTLYGCNKATETNELEVISIESSSDIDPDNPNELVGFADNVFVGYVEKQEDTEYKFPVTVETEDGTKEVSTPYTNYSISVVDNLKGKLKKNASIPMQKAGGVSEAEDVYLLYEHDFLPEEGKYYIFSTVTQPDGSLLISGPNSNVLLDVEDKDAIVSTDNYTKYSGAVKNEVKSNRERFESKYEE